MKISNVIIAVVSTVFFASCQKSEQLPIASKVVTQEVNNANDDATTLKSNSRPIMPYDLFGTYKLYSRNSKRGTLKLNTNSTFEIRFSSSRKAPVKGYYRITNKYVKSSYFNNYYRSTIKFYGKNLPTQYHTIFTQYSNARISGFNLSHTRSFKYYANRKNGARQYISQMRFRK